MIVTTSNPGQCAGGQHLHVDVTIGGQTRRLQFAAGEITRPLTLDEMREFMLTLLRIEWRTAGGNRLLFRTGIDGKSWDL